MTARTLDNIPIDQEIRELAYELWATDGGRSPARVSQLLRDAGHEVLPNTVGQWARRDGWDARFAELVRANFDGLRGQTVARLVSAGYQVAQQVDAFAASGQEPTANQVKFWSMVLDRAGFSPVGQDRTVSLAPSASSSDSPSALMDRYFPAGIPARTHDE